MPKDKIVETFAGAGEPQIELKKADEKLSSKPLARIRKNIYLCEGKQSK